MILRTAISLSKDKISTLPEKSSPHLPAFSTMARPSDRLKTVVYWLPSVATVSPWQSMKRHWPEFENSRSQDLPKEYHDSGTFYWYKLKDSTFVEGPIGAIVLSEDRVQDIDNEIDWKLAELKFRLLKAEN